MVINFITILYYGIDQELKKFVEQKENKDLTENILTSYFHSSTMYSIIEFIHESFFEYLVAEYYIECLLLKKPHRLNVGIPTAETINFLNSLLHVLENKNNNPEVKNVRKALLKSLLFYQKDFDSFKIGENKEVLEQIIKNSKETFESDTIVYSNQTDAQTLENFWISMNDNNYKQYSTLLIHKSIAYFVMASLKKQKMLNAYKVALFLQEYSDKLGPELRNFSYLDLSVKSLQLAGYSKVYSSGPDLSGIDLSTSNLSHTNLSGINLARSGFILANLYHTNLRNSNISKCDYTHAFFNGANLTNVYARGTNFMNSIFINCKLGGGKFDNCNFSDSIMINCSFDPQLESNQCQFNGSILDDPKLVKHLSHHQALNVPPVISSLHGLKAALRIKRFPETLVKYSLLR